MDNMELRLRNHIETIFSNMPQEQNTTEIKEEMLQNLLEKYHDLVSEGKDPETAYSIAISSIGDISSLFDFNTNTAELMEKSKKRSALLMTIAIMLYILCVVPVIICGAAIHSESSAIVGVCLMFVMIAVATGLIIYNSKTKYRPNFNNPNMVNEFRQWQSGEQPKNAKLNGINGALWSITVLVYLAVSFLTGAWHITWIIFLITVAIQQIIRLIFTFKN